MTEKVLPKGEDSDHSLPGRMDESNSAYYEPWIDARVYTGIDTGIDTKSKGRPLAIFGLVFVVAAAGIFSYYFLNQNEIDSQILDNTGFRTLEEEMVKHYNVGLFGSNHEHAALAIFVNGDKIDFSHPQFQVQSKYIHFENDNPYLIHRHATNVPLDMLFASFGLKVTSECLVLKHGAGSSQYCVDSENSMTFMVNGKTISEINLYEIKHGDRILISFGDSELVVGQLEYLKGLEIHNVPKINKTVPSRDIFI